MDEQESQLFEAIIIAITIIAGITAYFIFSVMRYQKKVLKIERQNAFAEISALEKDRSRIANDLHDELAPMLSAVKMKINSFELSDADDETQLEKTNVTIDDIAKRMRTISFDLMPSSLQIKGLLVAVQEFVNYINYKDAKLNIQLILPREPLHIGEQQAIHIYRIFQEVIQNTVKHAKADKLVIELKMANSMLTILSIDNGVGFDYNAELKETIGFGLRSLLNRTSLLHGNLEIQSKKGFGTTYLIEIPFKNV